MRSYIKAIVARLWVMPVASVVALVYGFFATGAFTPGFIFHANFLAGAALIIVAFALMILPASHKLDALTDHSTLAERHFERHRPKREKAYSCLFSGILVIVIAGLVQLALAVGTL